MSKAVYLCLFGFMVLGIANSSVFAGFRAGAAVVDVTPTEFPVYVNGGMLSRMSKEVKSKVYARAIAFDDGKNRLAIVIVDSCMVPRELLDEAKKLASKATKIPVENMLIAATHTHSAPSSFGALGTPSDKKYEAFLVPRLAEAIKTAVADLQPAQVGATVVDANKFTALRRWIRRPDKMLVDPFGNRSIRANMHPGPRSPDATGPSGPEDPDLSILSVQTRDGHPIALLANFANHYVGGPTIGSDYFGMFADRINAKVSEKLLVGSEPALIAMMSQGTSGDVWLYDYFNEGPRKRPDISVYTDGMVALAYKAYQTIEYKHDVTVAIAQTELPLNYRVPDAQHLHWAKGVVDAMKEELPKNTTEVYAREAVLLHEMQSTKIVLQAARIGEIGITAMPNEVYALTGLKLKALSPLKTTFNIELANGADGYIPPPEQHELGGYNTWPARSAGLEVQAEPKIVETVAQLLEKVAGKPRREINPSRGIAAKAIMASKPVAYWRMDEWERPRAIDLLGKHDGVYESGVVFYLEGPQAEQFNAKGETNRCSHFAGGRMRARVDSLGKNYSVSLWFWNGHVADVRPVTGYLFSRGRDHASNAAGDHVGLTGNSNKESMGRLFFSNGDQKNEMLIGKTKIERWEWHQLVLVRNGTKVHIYLDGKLELEGKADVTRSASVGSMFFGGRNDNFSNFEGRLDEACVFDYALSAKDIAKHYQAAANDDEVK